MQKAHKVKESSSSKNCRNCFWDLGEKWKDEMTRLVILLMKSKRITAVVWGGTGANDINEIYKNKEPPRLPWLATMLLSMFMKSSSIEARERGQVCNQVVIGAHNHKQASQYTKRNMSH